jgi:hypothetical protein
VYRLLGLRWAKGNRADQRLADVWMAQLSGRRGTSPG